MPRVVSTRVVFAGALLFYWVIGHAPVGTGLELAVCCRCSVNVCLEPLAHVLCIVLARGALYYWVVGYAVLITGLELAVYSRLSRFSCDVDVCLGSLAHVLCLREYCCFTGL